MAGIFSSIEISGSGLSVQRRKMNVVAENIANAETTKTPNGEPYRRQRLVIEAESEKQPFKTVLRDQQTLLQRTHERHIPILPAINRSYESVISATSEVVEEKGDAFRLVYDPSHPEANDDGYVKMPDVEIINEMVDMIAANRAYEANANAVTASKEMLKNALEI